MFPPLTKQQKCCHKSLVQQGFRGTGILPGQTLSLQKGRRSSKVYHIYPHPSHFHIFSSKTSYFFRKMKKIKKTVSLLEIQEVNLSFNKNLYSSSILYYIRNPIMQLLSPIHKTPPQNLAALYKICLWLLLLEEGPNEEV